jgi:chitodextrinase
VQNLSVLVGTTATSLSTVVGSAGFTFNPATANTVSIPLASGTTARFVRINITGNTGWPAAQLSELQVWSVPTGTPPDTTAPTAPGNLTSPAKTSNTVSLSWNASTDNVGVSSYQVRQAGNVVGSTAATTFTVTGLNPSTSYAFTVTAQDAAGNTSSPSNTLNVATNAAANTNLALNKPTAESSHVQSYGSGNAVNGDANSYWESNNNAFPQWLQVDLGAATSISRIVLKLPPASSWASRTETLSVQGSTNGSTFSTVVASAGYTFNPATGNTVTITFTATSTRYVRLNITGNTGWPAGQISEFETYAA